MTKKIASIPTKYLQDLVARVSFLEARLQALEQAARQLVYQISIDGEVQAACKDVVTLLEGDK